MLGMILENPRILFFFPRANSRNDTTWMRRPLCGRSRPWVMANSRNSSSDLRSHFIMRITPYTALKAASQEKALPGGPYTPRRGDGFSQSASAADRARSGTHYRAFKISEAGAAHHGCGDRSGRFAELAPGVRVGAPGISCGGARGRHRQCAEKGANAYFERSGDRHQLWPVFARDRGSSVASTKIKESRRLGLPTAS